ncbi:hypothetical protein [Leeuwenhoekiella aequorea]|uniref:Uncharacterized protein n=1 Tax=Leeuwenhoekiella aequorea TaxID=283736 RepID=A0A4Q0P2M2_9FLAO|nr:hypothetical protein [Leeuwenhoekiella aequorea]RXG20803.1 hypothetical protein DSM00_2907 [Leeuwenhoekiella aequorea]
MEDKLMSRKKPTYPINNTLKEYLTKYNREIKIPVFYEDLLRFSGGINIYDKNDNDTLWISVYYSEFERVELEESLKKVYTILHSDGSESMLPFLKVAAIDYCTFGNSKPFRIKINNIYNDNYTYFYVKKADASRVYGLDLEHILSPNRINFLVYKDTLIEEHIVGIPGDVFISEYLDKCDDVGKAQLAKEFVKFNERCMILLLGDMRSYNYVVIPTHDFDHIKYKIRAIDFDQQCFEGNYKVYKPHIFKENFKMVELVSSRLRDKSIEQYREEERAVLAKRIITSKNRLRRLLKCMSQDTISSEENLHNLRGQLYEYTMDMKFRRAQSMGQIVKTALAFVKRNYEDVSMKRIMQARY